MRDPCGRLVARRPRPAERVSGRKTRPGIEILPRTAFRTAGRHAAHRAPDRRGLGDARRADPQPKRGAASGGDTGADRLGKRSRPPRGAAARTIPRSVRLDPENLYPALRAVVVRYDLRRVGMVKDTVHTTVLDSAYMRGVRLLQERRYDEALRVLERYGDRNTIVALLSLGRNGQAEELLKRLPEDAVTEYLRAVVCMRLGRRAEGRRTLRRSMPAGAAHGLSRESRPRNQ